MGNPYLKQQNYQKILYFLVGGLFVCISPEKAVMQTKRPRDCILDIYQVHNSEVF